MWEIIKTMSNIPTLVRDEDPLKARGNYTIQQCLIAQGKKYLEKRYVACFISFSYCEKVYYLLICNVFEILYHPSKNIWLYL